MTNENCYEYFSGIFPFWDKINDTEKSRLCSNTIYAKYPKGVCIHGGDRECTGAIAVKSGSLRVYMMSDEGKEITLYRLKSGDVCMLSASCVLKSITFDVFVDTFTESEVYIINGRAFAETARNNIYVENYALSNAVSRFSDVMMVMQQILFMKLDRRLALFLYEEMTKTGNTLIKLTHDQVASYLGSAREVISRLLKYFENEGVVKLSRGGIQITDRKALYSMTL